jgi:hypothetical protein
VGPLFVFTLCGTTLELAAGCDGLRSRQTVEPGTFLHVRGGELAESQRREHSAIGPATASATRRHS